MSKETNKEIKSTRTKMERLTKKLTTKSSKIRILNSEGYTRSQIASFLEIRYQHVRNVLITPVSNPKK